MRLPWDYTHSSCIAIESTKVLMSPACFSVFVAQPRRSDLDMNQHVNNVKYIGWMLEVSIHQVINTFPLVFNC